MAAPPPAPAAAPRGPHRVAHIVPGYMPPPEGAAIDVGAEARAARQLLDHLVRRQAAVEKMLLPLAARLLKVTKDIKYSDLRACGYPNASELSALGVGREQLIAAGFDGAALREMGFVLPDTIRGLLGIGLDSRTFRGLGFSARDYFAAGLSPQELKDAGFTLLDLRGVGFTVEQLCKPQAIYPLQTVAIRHNGQGEPVQVNNVKSMGAWDVLKECVLKTCRAR